VCCDCCVLSGRGLCDGLITRPEEAYRLWRVVVCDQETSKNEESKPATGLWKIQSQWVVTPRKQTNKHVIEFVHVRQTAIYTLIDAKKRNEVGTVDRQDFFTYIKLTQYFDIKYLLLT
jgi:hypothetical protein